MAVVHVKLQKNTAPEEREDLLKTRLQGEATSVKPLFPGNTSSNLARLYSIDTGAVSANRILTLLHNTESVEYAEEAPQREPISAP